MCWPNLPKLHFWANFKCNLHVPIRPQLDLSVQSIENMAILYPLGILESDFWEYWKCAQLFAHWVHWSQMAGHIQNVLSICPLGISGSHNRVYLKCTQHLITGHIRVTLLGSNDPNTIPDPTRIRCSCFCMLCYVSARTPFLFGLSYVYVSFGLRTFQLHSLVILRYMFHALPFTLSLCFPRAHYVSYFHFLGLHSYPQP